MVVFEMEKRSRPVFLQPRIGAWCKHRATLHRDRDRSGSTQQRSELPAIRTVALRKGMSGGPGRSLSPASHRSGLAGRCASGSSNHGLAPGRQVE